MTEPHSTLCPRCHAPMLADGTVCWTCTRKAELDLDTIADFGNELVTALTRMTRIGRGDGPATGTRDEHPLPLDLRASELHADLHRTLTAWTDRARTALGLRPDPPSWALCKAAETTWCTHATCRAVILDPGRAHLSLRDMARLLRQHPRWIRRQDDAPALLDVLGRAASRMVAALDLPPDMIGLGSCDTDDCEGTIKAPREQAYARCRECGETYDVAHRREQRLKRAEGLRATPTLLAAVLTDLYAGHGIELKPNTITQWELRPPHKLRRRGTNAKGRALYRVGDVRDLYLAMINRELARRARDTAKTPKAASATTDTKETRAA